MTDAIQLSKLPPPDVVEVLSFEAYYAEAKARLKALDPTWDGGVESDPVNKLLQVLAYVVVQERAKKNDDARAAYLATAQRSDLDNWAANLGVTRLTITPAVPEQDIPAVMESDDDLRDRCTLAPSGFSVAGPDAAYEFHARSASGLVLDAKTTSPDPGHVVISVMARDGDGTASAELLATVYNYVSAANLRPLTDYVTVQSVEIVPFAVEATLWTFAGPDPDVALANARVGLDAYLASCRRSGRDITMSGLYAALQVAGIQNVEIASPASSITLDDTQAGYCESVTINYGGIGA
jgi:phage-related baseplate assembly protein